MKYGAHRGEPAVNLSTGEIDYFIKLAFSFEAS